MATGLGFYALAGGLAGAGKGLVEEARQDFEMMQDELRAKRAAAEAQKGRDFQGEQGRLTREQQVELQNDRLTSDEGQNDLNRRQQEKVAGITAGAAKDRDNEDAKRYSNTFTGGDGYLYERQKGGGPARKIVDDDGQPVKAPPSAAVKDPSKLTAAEMAKLIINATEVAMVDDFGTGGKVFDPNIYNRIISQIPGLRDALPPKGAGTEADPYTGTTQADINWFKANAKPGEVIVIDGKQYTK